MRHLPESRLGRGVTGATISVAAGLGCWAMIDQMTDEQQATRSAHIRCYEILEELEDPADCSTRVVDFDGFEVSQMELNDGQLVLRIPVGEAMDKIDKELAGKKDPASTPLGSGAEVAGAVVVALGFGLTASWAKRVPVIQPPNQAPVG